MKYKTDIYDLEKPLKVKLDKREYVDGVPITDKGNFKIRFRSVIRNIKYKIKRIFPGK